MGHCDGEYSEAGSLSLNIWVPDGEGEKSVLLWFHGGGWATGSASWAGYDGAALSASENIIIVTANYRLSAFGYAAVESSSSGELVSNLGLKDQAAALGWVARNIAAFGGDPAAITVGGQSAGAQAALLLAASPVTQMMVRGVFAQSPPMGWAFQSPSSAARVTEQLFDELELPRGDWTAYDEVAADSIVAAASAVSRKLSRPGILMPPFRVASDHEVPWLDLTEVVASLDEWPGRILIGHTAQEARAFLQDNPAVAGITLSDVRQILVSQFPGEEDSIDLRLKSCTGSVLQFLTDALVHFGHTEPTFCALEHRSRSHHQDYVYSFDWNEGPFGACHCVDIPFLFGPSQWTNAPMIQNASPDTLERITREFQNSVGSFVRNGTPGWPSAGAAGRNSHSFG